MVITTIWIIAGWLCGWMLLLSMRRLKPPERYPVQVGQHSSAGKDYSVVLPAMSVIILPEMRRRESVHCFLLWRSRRCVRWKLSWLMTAPVMQQLILQQGQAHRL